MNIDEIKQEFENKMYNGLNKNDVDVFVNKIISQNPTKEELDELINYFDEKSTMFEASQQAYKRAGNGMYGYLGTNMAHVYLAEVAEAITSQGVEFITRIQRMLENKGYTIIYGDTDSMFILVDDKIPNDVREKGDDEIKKWIREVFVKQWLYEDIKSETNVMAVDIGIPKGSKHWFEFKQEIIAKRGLFLKSKQLKKEYAKKRYILWIVDEEGVPKDELFSRGIEIRRSELSTFIRNMLEDWLTDLIKQKKSEKELLNDLIECKDKIIEIINNKEVSKIARYISISKDMDKYDDSMVRIRAAKFWNRYFADGEKYPEITEGTKTMVVQVKIKTDINFNNIKYDKQKFLKIYNDAIDNDLKYLTLPTDLNDNDIPDIIWDIFELDKDLILQKIFYDNVKVYIEMMGYKIDSIKFGVINADDLI